MGLPGETPETINQTLDYARSLGTFFGMHVLAPLPGSELFEKADELGLKILHRDWSLYDANHVVSETDGISAAQLGEYVVKLDKVYKQLEEMDRVAWERGELTGVKKEGVDRRYCKSFFWDLLRSGFFDGDECVVDNSKCADPLDALNDKAAGIAGVKKREAEKWITRAMDNGDLILEKRGDSTRLVFSDNVYPVKLTAAAGRAAKT